MENPKIPFMHGVLSFKITDKGISRIIAFNELTVAQLGHLYTEMCIVQQKILKKIEDGGNRDETCFN